MNDETLRPETGIHRLRSSSSPPHTPLPPEDEQPCSATRTFSYPHPRWAPEEHKPVQNRMKARSPEELLGLLTTASTVGKSLRLPSPCTGLAVLARHHSLC